MPSASHVVALFDIDGTLVRTEGASPHSRAFKAAFRRVYGKECSFTVGMHGMTDLQIFTMLASDLQLDDGRHKELATEACRYMAEIYRVRDEADGRYVALPGVRETLETLRGRGVVLGLVTGTCPRSRRISYSRWGWPGSSASAHLARKATNGQCCRLWPCRGLSD